jgi:NADPH-dependent ferric siderophore reductase
MGRPVRVLGIDEPAAGFLEVELRAAAPYGGWRPGHEIQFRVAPTLARRYTVRTVGGPDAERIGILVATDAAGPGTTWIRHLRVGAEATVLAGWHRPLREHGTRRLYLGDGSALGAIDGYARDGDEPIVTVEVPADAVAPLADRWPRYRFLPAAAAPGDALQAWLEHAAGDGELASLDGALLLGHAQSIQRQRRALVDGRILPRRAITTKPYWATGKAGL